MAVVGTITAPHRSGSANLRVELQLIQQLGQSAFLLHSTRFLSKLWRKSLQVIFAGFRCATTK